MANKKNKSRSRKVSQEVYDKRKQFNNKLDKKQKFIADNKITKTKTPQTSNGYRLAIKIPNKEERKAYLQALLNDFDEKIRLDKIALT